MNAFNIIVAALGLLVLMLGLTSRARAGSMFAGALLSLVAGVLLGPEVLGWIDLARIGDRGVIVEHAARLTLGIGLLGVALRVPRSFPREHGRELVLLISVGMILMWLITTALIVLILGLPLWLSALIAAALTPTDPIASSSIVAGELAEARLRPELRHTISFESGANDGLAYLLLMLPFLLLTRPANEALSHWLLNTLLWEVACATIAGLFIGWVAARLLQRAERLDLIEEDWRLVYTVALALFAVGVGRLMHTDEVLLVFAAGAAFVQVVSSDDRHEEERGQEAVNRFFSVPMFALIGIALPWDGWRALGWPALLLAAAILVMRRVPVLLLLRPFLPAIRSRREALFAGWFGPIAIAAAYYATLMAARLEEPLIWDVVSLVICASTVAHGVTAAPLTRRMGGNEGRP